VLQAHVDLLDASLEELLRVLPCWPRRHLPMQSRLAFFEPPLSLIEEDDLHDERDTA
jgi:hypothetical protein